MEVSRSEPELESLVGRIDRGDLDLQPNFQRGDIWDLKRRQRLIDSLLREWYVPAIHIVRDAAGGPDQVLDGQQRLIAIRDFFHDVFAVDGTIEPASEEIQALNRLKFSRLPDEWRRRLQRFALPCVTLRDYGPQEPNELFFRLNQSYNLTPPEKRNALYGQARHQVKDLIVEFEKTGLLVPAVVGFDNKRLAYDDIVARACLAVERGNLKQHINNNVVERFYREAEFSDATLEGMLAAGRELWRLCNELEIRIRFNKATLFSWLVFCFWVPRAGIALPASLLAQFEDTRRAIKQTDGSPAMSPTMVGVVSLYDDRASYRVTDVSSVLARDCVLYLYLMAEYGVEPRLGADGLLHELNGQSEGRVQQIILDFVSATEWGLLDLQIGSA